MRKFLLIAALAIPFHALADTCQMYTSTPPTSSSADGVNGSLTCNKQGQIGVQVNGSALPSGAATAANQATQITAEQATAANTAGISTAANQTTGNASLSTIATNTAGAATAANQTSVQSAPGTPAATAIGVQGVAAGVPVPVSGTVNVENVSTGAPLEASTTGVSTSNVAATLAAASGKTTYITGFSITCLPQAATTVSTTITISGIATGQTYQLAQFVASASVVQRNYAQPVPAAALDASIIVTVNGVASGSVCSVNAEGFQQ